jgi:cell division protein FtsZ
MKKPRGRRLYKMSSTTAFKVIGVGGSGCAAVEKMVGCGGCEIIAVNTDAKSLLENKAPNKVLIGLTVTKGRSTGNNIRLGETAALSDRDKIKSALDGAKEVFIIAGLGGGTGAGAAPVVAEAAKSIGCTVVAFVNTPFAAEGKVCKSNASAGLENLRPYCDLIVVIENDRFLRSVPDLSIRDAFIKVNHLLLEAVRGMIKLTVDSGIENIKPLLQGYATLAYGVGPTLKKAVDAALQSPLIGGDLRETTGILVNFTTHMVEPGGLQEALDDIASKTNPKGNIVWTNIVDNSAESIEVLAVFTGIKPKP